MWTGNGLNMLPSLHGQNQMTDYKVAGSMTSTSTLDVQHTFPVGASDGLSIGKLSRKRNITDMHKDNDIYNDGSSVHRENFIYDASHIPCHAYSDQDAGRFYMGNNLGGEIYMKQNSPFILQDNMLHQRDNHCTYDINKFPSASLTTWTKEVAKPENPVPSNFHQQDPSSSMGNSAVVEIPRSIYSQHFTYNVTNPAEAKIPQLNGSGSDAYMGKNQANLSSLNRTNFQQVSRSTPSPALITSSRSLMSSEFSQQRMFGDEVLSHVGEHDKKNNDVISTAYAHNAASFPTSSASITFASESQNLHEFSESQRRFLDGHPVNMVTSELHNGSVRYQTVAVMEENHLKFGRSVFHKSTDFDTNPSNLYSSSSGNIIHSVVEENGSSKIGSHVTKESYEAQSLSSLNGEGNPHTGKSASATAEKLWDGTLQLNTSTTVSALAFFRSGEKSTDIDWPQHVEVKGKVRLEAFEKFVQELPRSRNRGLMVISLCWRIGSSESGLTGLKEVARGYKEGQRVGYAQPCSGIDLYVCPRCETIITILAKYGFFKGTKAVEEDQDSLIGCVVWRRNRTPLNSSLKKSEAKNSPLEKSEKSPSDFAIQNAEQNSAETKTPYSEHSQNILNTEHGNGNSTFQTQLGFIENTGNWHEKKKFFSGIPTATVGNLKLPSESAAPSIQFNPSVISMQFPEPHYSKSSTSQTLAGQNLDHEIPTSMTRDTGCVPMPPSTHGVLKNTAAVDDDLPEFDFGNTCGNNQLVASRYWQSSHQEDFSVNSHQMQVEEGKTRLLAPPAQPPLPPGPPPAHVSRPVDATTFQAPSYFIHSFPTSASISGEHVSKCGSAEQTHETSGKPATLGDNALPTIVSKSEFQRKNIWDDGDDMPEWCPPDMDHKDLQRAPPPPPPPPLPLPQPMPPTQPPLPPYPRPPACVVSGPRSPPIPQETSEIASSWPSRTPSSQFLDYPPNNQGHTPADKAGLLGPGPQSSTARLPMTTRHVSGNFQSDARPPANHRNETLGSQSSRFEARSYRRPSPTQNLDRTTRHWHSGFDQEHGDPPYIGCSQNENLRHRSTGFDPKPGQDWSPRRKHDETSKRRRTGFDVLPDHRYSPVLPSKQLPNHRPPPTSSPKQSSTRRRPSLFDVKPQLPSKDWRR